MEDGCLDGRSAERAEKLKRYPYLSVNYLAKIESIPEVVKVLKDIVSFILYATKERKNDVSDFNALKDVFISGRKVGKIPTGASDVTDLDVVGDFNIADDAGTVYLYALVNVGGTATWRRVAMSSW